jgi:hypothetical protein
LLISLLLVTSPVLVPGLFRGDDDEDEDDDEVLKELDPEGPEGPEGPECLFRIEDGGRF